MSEQIVPIISQCLCRANTFTSSVKKSALPLKAVPCHCDSCRHVSGTLYFSAIAWPDPEVDLSPLQQYRFSETLVDYFCGTCGSHMFCKRTTPGAVPNVLSGTLNNAPGLVEYSKHIFVRDTLDGGATPWLRENYRDGQHLRCWKEWYPTDTRPGEEHAGPWPDPAFLPEPLGKVAPGTTPFRCHCRGVNLLLRSAADDTTPDDELPFYIDPDTRKYLATSCACESCRRASGADMMSWTYSQLSHIEFPPAADGSKPRTFPLTVSALKEAVSAPADARDPRLGTLVMYQSSPDVERYHCSRCSATCFYAVSDRPTTIEISVGLLCHPSGARAEELLRWDYASLATYDDDKGGWREGFINQAKKESDEWRAQRGYPEVWKRVQEERKKARNVNLRSNKTT